MAWRVILSGTGPMPSIVTEADTVVTPPPPPPPPTPPPSPPVVDTSPFVWPSQPRDTYYADERWTGVGEGFYLAQPRYRNPLPGSHGYAGRYGDDSVWAPRDAPPATIRRVLATGHP